MGYFKVCLSLFFCFYCCHTNTPPHDCQTDQMFYSTWIISIFKNKTTALNVINVQYHLITSLAPKYLSATMKTSTCSRLQRASDCYFSCGSPWQMLISCTDSSIAAILLLCCLFLWIADFSQWRLITWKYQGLESSRCYQISKAFLSWAELPVS